jgi:uncharacterized protein YcaQ
MTLDDLRRFAVARSLFRPTTLPRALNRMGFVQADPIRAPARAQDLILRHRVRGYRAGDLERRYPTLDIEEDFFVDYGFVTRRLHALMHPRSDRRVPAGAFGRLPGRRQRHAMEILEFVRARPSAHPRDVDAQFLHGKMRNYWGGSSNATTHLLDAMHYQGLLRVVRRDRGVRVYAAHAHASPAATAEERRVRIDALVDAVVNIYAPLPARSLSMFVRRLRYATPQWTRQLDAALQRARARFAHARAGDVDWFWPAGEDPRDTAAFPPPADVRLLAPFDPIVKDRYRFELLWHWAYRFEAYTPAAKRVRGYYALPLLWGDRVIGWSNLAVKEGILQAGFGFVGGAPRGAAFRRALDAELERMRIFLGSRADK